jgi:hypothetical protein
VWPASLQGVSRDFLELFFVRKLARPCSLFYHPWNPVPVFLKNRAQPSAILLRMKEKWGPGKSQLQRPAPTLAEPQRRAFRHSDWTGGSALRTCTFLHHFCIMKRNSKLYRETPGKVLSKSQPILSELVASYFDQGKASFGKETVKFWMLYQPLTSTRQVDGKVLAKFYDSALGKEGFSQPGSYFHSHRPRSISARPLPISAFRFQFSAFTLSLSRRAPKTVAKSGQIWPEVAKSGHAQRFPQL